MKLFRKIVCPVDFSEYSTLALRYAVALSDQEQAELVVYHSVPDLGLALSYLEGNYTNTTQELLVSNASTQLDDYLADKIPSHLPCIKTIGTGTPSDAILETALAQDADLVVMGTHGYAGEDRLFLGSVTRNVLHKSPIPVLVVCKPGDLGKKEREPQIQLRQILLAHDLLRNNAKIRDVALSAARIYQSDVTFLYVAQRSSGQEWLIQEKQSIEKLRQILNPENENWCRIQFLVESRDSAETFQDSMERQGMDLLLMGHHQRPPVEEFFLENLASPAVVRTETPVLLVRSQSDFIGI